MTNINSQEWKDTVALMRKPTLDLGQEPGHGARFLRRLTSSLDALAAQHQRSWGLNANESRAVHVLWEFGRMTMTDLGRRIPLSRAAVTTLTDRLEERGFVKREPDPRDRRRIMLLGTPLLEQEMARIYGEWDEHVNRVLDRIGHERRYEIIHFLDGLIAASHTRVDELALMSDEEVRGEEPKTPKRQDVLPEAW